mmetsp:Transcript_249/g.405  ORF Transcript_249/g.405 Transcript_249/m.405 type:complete len:263 (-) Transcript_249:40-828(-)
MIFQRRMSLNKHDGGGKDRSHQEPNSASSTALSCSSEKELRTACYCEENIWRLAYRRLRGSSREETVEEDSRNDRVRKGGNKENEEYYVVFVSNKERCCPMFHQIASDHPMKACFWDYHVILIQATKVMKRGKQVIQAQVLDLDTHLPFPTSLEEYLQGTFGMKFASKKDERMYAPMFRVIRAEYYLETFFSDRMHMVKDGTWIAKPPTYECITTANMTKNKHGFWSNLDDYIDMSRLNHGRSDSKYGEVLTLDQLKSKFGL